MNYRPAVRASHPLSQAGLLSASRSLSKRAFFMLSINQIHPSGPRRITKAITLEGVQMGRPPTVASFPICMAVPPTGARLTPNLIGRAVTKVSRVKLVAPQVEIKSMALRGRVGRHAQAGGRHCQNWADDQQ